MRDMCLKILERRDITAAFNPALRLKYVAIKVGFIEPQR